MHFIGNLPNKRYRCYSHNRIPDKVRDPGRFSARSHRRIWHLHNWSRWLSRRSSCLRSLRSWTDSRNLHVPVLSYCISMYLHHMIILCTILCTIIYVCVNVWVTGCSLSISERSLLLYSELWSIMIYYDLFIPVNMHNSLQVCLISFKLPWHGRDAMRLGSLRSLRRLRRLLPLLLGHQAGQRLAACGLWRIISAIESLQSFHNVIFINIPYHSNIIEYSIFNGIIWN